MTMMTTELICVYAMTMFYFSVLPQRNDEDVIFRTGEYVVECVFICLENE